MTNYLIYEDVLLNLSTPSCWILYLYLSLFQGSLDFRLLSLNSLLGLLQLMNALSSLTKLLRQVRDLLCNKTFKTLNTKSASTNVLLICIPG